jgi:tripartite motif-containing protein 71
MRQFVWPIAGAVVALLCGLGMVCAAEAKAAKFLLSWGKKGDKPGEFSSPIGIVINGKDEIFVSDLNNARVQKFSTQGKHLGGALHLPADTPKRKSTMIGGLAVDDKGLLYLSFMIQHKVAVYTEAGKLVREWGKNGKGDGEFAQPGGIVLGKDGVYVADQGNHRVQKFTPEGKFLGKWGEYGARPGQFGSPESVGSRFAGPHWLAQDSKGRLYTTEGVVGRVQQFSAQGKALLAWGNKGDKPGGFGGLKTGYAKHTFGPIGLLVDSHDRVWVSSLNDRVQLFTPEGKYLLGIGGSGDKDGQFARPHGMAVDSKGHLYVCDAGNQRIQKFEIPAP